MNSVTLIGRLTKDPELKGSGDRKVCQLRLAENGGRKSDNPLYIDVAAFGRQAEVCAKHLAKGRQVAVGGRLRLSEWEAKDGSKRSRHSIVADRVEFLGGRQNGGGSPQPERELEEAY
jgi:single-strand DNA-binding protein